MVNFYGAGKAFNLKYQQQNYKMMPRPAFQHAQQRAMLFGCRGHHQCGPQNVTINNGPQGFWGFMSGLLGGLFGGGMMGGMMGMGGFNQMPTSAYGLLNQGIPGAQPQDAEAADKAKKFQNLQTMYSKYKVIDNDNGTYTITKGEGDVVANGTYDELIQGLPKTPTTPENTTKKTPAQETTTPGTTTPGTTTPGAKTTGTTTPETTTPGAKTTDGKGDGAATAVGKDDLTAGVNNGTFTVHDAVRGTAGDIKRDKFTVGADNAQGYPESITVGNYKYEFVEVKNGTAYYKSINGNAGNENIYRLEKNADGTFGLNQYEGDTGAGKVDITNKTQTPKPEAKTEAPKEEAPKEEAPKVNTEEAYNAGYKVANHLIGITNDQEWAECEAEINKLTPDTVTDFVKGYNKNSGGGYGIISQINTEYGDHNKEQVAIKKIVTEVIAKADKAGIDKTNSNYVLLSRLISNGDDKIELGKNGMYTNFDNALNNLIKEIDKKEAEKAQ